MSGKTNVVRNLLHNPEFGLLDHFGKSSVFLVSPTLHQDSSWSDLKLPKYHKLLGWKDSTMNEIARYSAKQKNGTLIILDDCAADTEVFNAHKVSTLCGMMMTSRHQKVSWIITSQYFRRMPGIVRSNASHVIAFKFSNTAEEKGFLSENNDMDIEPYYRAATSARSSFIYINRQQGRVFRKFEEQLLPTVDGGFTSGDSIEDTEDEESRKTPRTAYAT